MVLKNLNDLKRIIAGDPGESSSLLQPMISTHWER